MRVRLGVLDDIPRLQQIERSAAALFMQVEMPEIADSEPLSAEALSMRIDEGRLLVIGDEQVAGFTSFRVEDDWAYVEELVVDPHCAGRRLGALLLDALGEMAERLGLSGLVLSTFRDVPWNAPYYRQLGFVDVPDETLTPALLAIRREHESWGVDETQRVFMRRPFRRGMPVG